MPPRNSNPLTATLIQRFYGDYYVAENLTIVVAGTWTLKRRWQGIGGIRRSASRQGFPSIPFIREALSERRSRS